MPARYCELELRIKWIDPGRYFIEANFVDPDGDLEKDLLLPHHISVDHDELRELLLKPEAYGSALSRMVFGNKGSPVYAAFERARAASNAAEGNLRLRLHIQKTAPELHGTRWELLKDPAGDGPLLALPHVWFSRYLGADDFPLREKRDQDAVSVLVVISNPSDLESKWGRARLDPDAEYARADRAIASKAPGKRPVTTKRLAGAATIYTIVDEIRKNYYDVLYLACHGAFTVDQGPRLLLENANGTGEMVKGEQLVERLAVVRERPRLVILASCQSAGGVSSESLGAIAPRLAKAGIPSVIAMQGDFSLNSAQRFMPTLFRELATHGQIDHAVAEARADIRGEPDWWMPVMYTHSRSGSLWPKRATGSAAFDRWKSVLSDLKEGSCLPILGPGLVEAVLGSTRDMARGWAERHEYPLAPRDRDDLAQVAQYLAHQQSRAYALAELRDYMAHYIRDKFDADLDDDELRNAPVNSGLVDKLVSRVGQVQRERNEHDVHKLLARLPLSIYVNANRDNLLRDALVEAGKRPHVQLCAWRSRGGRPVKIGPPRESDHTPSAQEPLIYHPFGNLQYPESLVLTEDDYFSFLTTVTRVEGIANQCVPPAVDAAMASAGLMLLGFQADDWDFRVLFSSIMNQPGAELREGHAHVSIQMNPEEGKSIDPDRTCRYLKEYFTRHKQIDLFWGSADEFMMELTVQLKKPR